MHADPSQPDETAVFTLHRYFIWANRLRNHLEDAIEDQGPMPDTTPGMPGPEREAVEQAARIRFLPVFLYSSYWFSSLYVVVEGWRELGLTDPVVDPLLEREFLDLLRRYRNAIFHYQPAYLDERVSALAGAYKDGGHIDRARRLHDAFSDYFLNWFQKRGELPSPPH